MKVVQVDLSERSYQIYIGQGLLQDAHLLRDVVRGKDVMVVTDSSVQKLYLESFVGQCAQQGFKVASVVLTAGEMNKNLTTTQTIWDALLENGFGRDVTVIALGGGVVGDITGFAAALYHRGVDFIQVPTTLLSQVDSSVGGKTGVNLPLGKNLIGAFYQPRRVIIDTNVLNTLPKREVQAGIAEIIKYGLIWDADFFAALEQLDPNQINAADFEWAIERSCQIKAEVVAQDEREGGLRAILNLGHTFGHAFETLLGYGTWLHGEAVGMGMVLAADLSVELGLLDSVVLSRAHHLIEKFGLPCQYPETLKEADILKAMGRDKKVIGGRLRLILLSALGRAIIRDDVEDQVILKVLSKYRAKA